MQYKTEAKPRAMAGGIPVFCSHDSIEQVEKLVPNPKNPNQHSSEQIALLARIITATGWRQVAPMILNERYRRFGAEEAGE